MSEKYPGGLITKNPVTPTGGDTGTAPGIWTLDQQMQYQKAGTWPSPPPIGSLYMWGNNGSGQLGLGNRYSSQSSIGSPTQVGSGSNTVNPSADTITNGGAATYFIRPDGTLWVAGSNVSGQLGDNSNVNRSSPVQLSGSWKFVTTGTNNAFALKSDGTLWSWGYNISGQLGQNLSDVSLEYRSSPVQVAGTWQHVTAGAGIETVLAVKTDGTLWFWGRGNYGTPGLNISGQYRRSSPVQVGSDTNWSKVWFNSDASGASTGSAFGLKTDGTLWAWGVNNYGELGTNNVVNYSSPVQVGSDTDWAYARLSSLGNGVTVFRKTNGAIYTAGTNESGGLGLNLVYTSYRSSPTQVGSKLYKSVSAGNGNFVAVDNNGIAWAWGNAVGDNTTVNRSSPVQIGQNGGPYLFATEATSYSNMTGLIESSGKLYMWGSTDTAASGTNRRILTNYSRPVQIGNFGFATYWSPANTQSLSFSANIRYDNTLWVSGGNTHGQLGQSNKIDYSSPVQIAGSWAAVGLKNYSMMGIKTDGTLWGWGENSSGELGLGNKTEYSSPVQVGALNTWQNIKLASDFGLGYKIDQTLWSWGYNGAGELGQSNTTDSSSPVQIAGSWLNISPGIEHVIATKVGGTLWSWGYNVYGVLGKNDDSINRSSPVQIGALTTWVIPSTAYYSGYATKNDGTLWAWGNNDSGQLGTNSNTIYSSPIQVGALTTWSNVVSGGLFAFGMQANNQLWAWGANYDGQLAKGISNFTASSSPVQISGSWYSISTSQYDYGAVSFGTKSDGTLWSWGLASSGQLGINATGYSSGSQPSSPVQVGALTTWKKISAAQQATYGILSNGTLWAWGINDYGNLGQNDGYPLDRSSPVQVGSDTNWANVAGGNSNSVFGIKTNGTLWAWGNGVYGRLGLGNAITYSSPVQVGSETDWTFIADGNGSTFNGGLRGTALYVWGAGNSGQLGQNDGTFYSSPVQISGSWKSFSNGYNTGNGVKSDGTLWGWGSNLYGQIGNNSDIYRSSPVQIGSDTNWSSVVSGYTSTFALKTNGTLWAWGDNNYGQLGKNNTITYSSPVQVGSDTNWAKVYCKYSNVLAIKTDGTLWSWGWNQEGTIGNNTQNINYSSPVQIGSLTTWGVAGISSWTGSGIVRA